MSGEGGEGREIKIGVVRGRQREKRKGREGMEDRKKVEKGRTEKKKQEEGQREEKEVQDKKCEREGKGKLRKKNRNCEG